MKVLDPNDPLRADHRKLKDLLEIIGKAGKIQHLPEEYDWVVAVFGAMGGSWEAVFKGSAHQISLLKKILKHAIKAEILSPKPSWTEGVE